MSQILDDGNNYITALESVVYALDGNDRIFTAQAAPRVYGGEGADFIGNQGASPMEAYGGQGNDAIHGGPEQDDLYGDNGDDLLQGGEFDYTRTLSGHLLPSPTEPSGNDALYGGAGNDALYGWDGDDTLYGGDGDDSNFFAIVVKDHNAAESSYLVSAGLYGGMGNDVVDGGLGHDYIDGGDGNDNLLGGDGNDWVSGGLDSDTIDGGKGDDHLFGGEPTGSTASGNDSLDGGNGNDRLDGGGGADIMRGGLGNDTYYVDTAADIAIEHPGEGIDTVSTFTSYSLTATNDVEILISAALGLNLTGSNVANRITGDGANNILKGMGGNDDLIGLWGSDRLFGANGNDELFGMENNDFLYGGLGNDTLAGGTGRDYFVFETKPNSKSNFDRITDFRSVDDTIWIDNALFTKAGPNGALNPDAFHLGKSAADAEDRINYDRSTGNLWYDADGTGSIVAVRFAILINKPSVALNDFSII